MSIYKVAKLFQKKLSLASTSNFQNLQGVYRSAISLTSPNIKALWVNSGSNDAYEDISDILSSIRNIAISGYNQAVQLGMPANGNHGYAGFLNNISAATQKLKDWRPSKPLDPMASNKLSDLERSIATAQSQFTPVGIPAQNVTVMPEQTIVGDKPIVMPTQTIVGDRPTSSSIDTGEGYQGEDEDNMSYMPLGYK